MPIFEYHCNDCGTEFEVLERSRDANKSPKCPSCGAHDARKRFSRVRYHRDPKGDRWREHCLSDSNRRQSAVVNNHIIVYLIL